MVTTWPDKSDLSPGYGDNPTWGQVYGGHVEMLVAAQELPGAVPPQELTIAAGSITPTRAGVIVDTEGGAAADDLSTINTTTLHDGAYLLLRAADVSRVVTVKHGTGVGAIALDGDADVDLSPDAALVLRRDGDSWREVRMLRAATAESLEGVLGIASGGTGATNAADARANLDVPSIGDVGDAISDHEADPLAHDLSGQVLQTVVVQSNSSFSITAQIAEGAPPTSTDGVQIISTAFTPKKSGSTVLVTLAFWGVGGSTSINAALFQSGSANAISAGRMLGTTAGSAHLKGQFTSVTGGASITISARAGRDSASGTAYVNRLAGSELFGASSVITLTIEEIAS